MWFRAVATAIAAWCVAGAAVANGYAEVWNPPEAGAHARHGATKHLAGKPATKPTTKPATKKSGKHAGDVATATPAAHDGVRHGAGASVKRTAAIVGGHAKRDGARGELARKPHAQIVRTKSGEARAVHADIARGHAVHRDAPKGAATAKGPARESQVAQPTAAQPKPHPQPVSAGADQTDAAADPATARSGSLPPILH